MTNIDQMFTQAATACEKKDFKTAKAILKDLLHACPTYSEAYRLLGQIASEEGNTDKAIDYLIESLTKDPKNMWALIMMGNVYAKKKGDIETARQYFDKVLEYYPDNSYALNNLAAVMMETKEYQEAIGIFKKVLSLDKTYPNCYFGMAMAYIELNQWREAFEIALEGSKVSVDRPENKSVREELLKIMLHSARNLVKQTNYMNVVLGIKDELEADGKTKIKIINDDTLKVYAKLEYAKHHRRDVNVVRYNDKMENVEHLMIHELGHLRMQKAATNAGKGKVFCKKDANDAAFNKKFGQYIRKQLLNKIPNEEIVGMVRHIQEGISLQLMNCPLDLFVERYIYEHYPIMRPIQLLMLFYQEQDNIKGVKNGENTPSFPTKIVKANKVMNICTSLHFKEMYGINLIHEYTPTKAEFDQAKDMFDEFHAYWYAKDLEPGEEYDLVEYFLETLDMEDLISMVDEDEFYGKVVETSQRPMTVDDGDYDIYTEEEKERQRTFEENSKKADPARDMMMTMYILAALEEFSQHTYAEVRKIAMEIAMLGMSGIDPGKKSGYRIPSIDRDFGGFLLLAYYYTSWKLTIPESAEQLGLPYRDQYEAAQSLYEKKYGERLKLI